MERRIQLYDCLKYWRNTIMHSSRMRTVRNSSHLLAGGVSTSPPPRSRHPPRAAPHQSSPPPEQPRPGGAGTPWPDPPQLSPWLLAWTRSPSTSPLAVCLETPPPHGQIPQTSPLGVGLETCKACWDTTCKVCWDTVPPPPPWTARHL